MRWMMKLRWDRIITWMRSLAGILMADHVAFHMMNIRSHSFPILPQWRWTARKNDPAIVFTCSLFPRTRETISHSSGPLENIKVCVCVHACAFVCVLLVGSWLTAFAPIRLDSGQRQGAVSSAINTTLQCGASLWQLQGNCSAIAHTRGEEGSGLHQPQTLFDPCRKMICFCTNIWFE